ncbi:MAG: tRNA-dihydrouridine synthase family protein [Treponemataceae bacterium]|nr:tRNA-dihydrouridine synthase family protein [Treponemataceae bacterium]
MDDEAQSKKIKLLLAPMATLSHEALRRAIFRFGGCDEYYCEMIHASSLLAGGGFEKYYIMNGPESDKMVWQLTDTTDEPIIKAAKIVNDLGGIGVDINMGCPAPEIYRHGAGMAWMNKDLSETAKMLEKIEQILQNGTSSCKRLSVKCRLGEDDFTDEKFFSFIDMLVSSGVKQIVLHPRTRKQKYSRPARWSYVEKLCEYCAEKYPENKISVIGNGDVKDITSAKTALETAPDADGIMLARYAVQKPWLFAQIAHGSKLNEKLDLYEFCDQYLSDIRECQPKEFWKTRTQRFFVYYCDNFSFANYLKSKMLHAESHTEQLQILKEYLEKQTDEKIISL